MLQLVIGTLFDTSKRAKEVQKEIPVLVVPYICHPREWDNDTKARYWEFLNKMQGFSDGVAELCRWSPISRELFTTTFSDKHLSFQGVTMPINMREEVRQNIIDPQVLNMYNIAVYQVRRDFWMQSVIASRKKQKFPL